MFPKNPDSKIKSGNHSDRHFYQSQQQPRSLPAGSKLGYRGHTEACQQSQQKKKQEDFCPNDQEELLFEGESRCSRLCLRLSIPTSYGTDVRPTNEFLATEYLAEDSCKEAFDLGEHTVVCRPRASLGWG